MKGKGLYQDSPQEVHLEVYNEFEMLELDL
jgi:hypothetical protein